MKSIVLLLALSVVPCAAADSITVFTQAAERAAQQTDDQLKLDQNDLKVEHYDLAKIADQIDDLVADIVGRRDLSAAEIMFLWNVIHVRHEQTDAKKLVEYRDLLTQIRADAVRRDLEPPVPVRQPSGCATGDK